MRIAITSSGDDLKARLHVRFRRAPKFIIFEQESGSFKVVENQQDPNAAQGAGIQAVQTVINSGAQALVTGHCGPRMIRALNSAGVKVYLTTAPSVAEALEQLKTGRLVEAQPAGVEEQQ